MFDSQRPSLIHFLLMVLPTFLCLSFLFPYFRIEPLSFSPPLFWYRPTGLQTTVQLLTMTKFKAFAHVFLLFSRFNEAWPLNSANMCIYSSSLLGTDFAFHRLFLHKVALPYPALLLCFLAYRQFFSSLLLLSLQESLLLPQRYFGMIDTKQLFTLRTLCL